MVKFQITDKTTELCGCSCGDVLDLPEEAAKAYEKRGYGKIVDEDVSSIAPRDDATSDEYVAMEDDDRANLLEYYEPFTVEELKLELKEKGLKKSGLKEELIDRLIVDLIGEDN